MQQNQRLVILTALFMTLTGPVVQALDTDGDGDGVDDVADNCIEHANADQRDSNVDGFGNRCDADFNGDDLVNFIDLGYLRSVFFSDDPDADLNGDGVVNVVDLGIFRSLFFRPPGPAGSESNPGPNVTEPPPSLDVQLRVIDGCPFSDGSFGHQVTVAWSTAALGSTANVNIQAIPNDGSPTLAIGSGNPGNATFTLRDPYGGALQVVAQAQSGDTAVVGSETTELTPCFDRPVIPPGLGFVPQPQNEPPVIGVPDGTPDEIDVIALGGSNNGPVEPRAAVAVGTGAGFKLFAYEVDFNGTLPLPLVEAGPIAGIDVKLHTLSPQGNGSGAIHPFLSGYRRDGNLWLRSWQLVQDNNLQDFAYNGYGAQAQVDVAAYDLAHRVLPGGDYQVVTPVRTARGALRTITWRVDRQTGVVSGVQDSGDWGSPSPTTELSIAHLKDELYVVTYRNRSDELTTRYWRALDNGQPIDNGGMSSGLGIRGNGTVDLAMSAVKVMPLGEDEFMTTTVDRSTFADFRLSTWESRFEPIGDSDRYVPYLISDNSRDTTPNASGITIVPQPTPTNATNNGTFLQNVRALVTDALLENSGIGQGEVFTQIPVGEMTSVAIASVSKTMTLLLAVEAIDRGDISLSDEIEVSALAANLAGPNWSDMGLEAGERQTLETLLHGMMMVSANDASGAIAEHVSGDWLSFVDSMNARANLLGMSNTSYQPSSLPGGTAAGGGVSTPQDQVTLWHFANQNPLFRELASVRVYSACGEDADGDEKCHILNKSQPSFPGTEGWKGGNGGYWLSPYSENGGPFCVGGGGCLIAETTRLNRSMQVALQQSGDRWGDHEELLVYAYRDLFTPDRRGPTYIASSVVDFALDHIGSQVALVAYVDDSNRPQFCTWSAFVDGGQLFEFGCDQIDFNGVAGSALQAAPNRVDGERLSTFLVEGDYMTAYTVVSTGQLNLNLWRVAPREP
ncbi:MAG: serine hydrolase [Pseudomonadota bacterium]